MNQRQATFGEAVKSALVENYCNFSGRASRSQYWWYILFTYIISLILAPVVLKFGTFGTVLNIIVSLALMLPGLGIAVRRLHDIGKSGWWYFINLILIIGNIIFIVWCCQPSSPYPNEYGQVPLAEE